MDSSQRLLSARGTRTPAWEKAVRSTPFTASGAAHPHPAGRPAKAQPNSPKKSPAHPFGLEAIRKVILTAWRGRWEAGAVTGKGDRRSELGVGWRGRGECRSPEGSRGRFGWPGRRPSTLASGFDPIKLQ